MPYLKKEALCPEPIDCKILTAALNLIVDRGYQRVSIHDIQRESSVSIGSIYKHFGGKEGVARGLYTHIINEFNELIDGVVNTVSSPSEQCNEIINQLFQHTESHSNIIAFLFNTKHSDFISELPSLYNTDPIHKIKNIIQQAITQGEFKNIDPIIIFSGIFGSAIHMIQLRLDNVIEQPLSDAHSIFIKSFKR